MSVLERLASALGRRDEAPNQQLAAELAHQANIMAIAELAANLQNKNKDIQSDCIKVLYEIGAIKPELITPFANEFASLLQSKNNRLQWGAMTALNTITNQIPQLIFENLGNLISIAEKGSVITRDNLMSILTKLMATPMYANDALLLFNEQLLKAPVNQLPMYAENALPVVKDLLKDDFVHILQSRLHDIDKESKRKRVEKVLRKLV